MWSGRPGFMIYAGFVNNPLPTSELYNGYGSYRSFAFEAPYSFAAMRMNEFLSDRFIYLFSYHNIGNIFFRSQFSRPELLISFHAGIGTLQEEWRHQGIEFKTMEKGYFESGIRLNHLLDLKMCTLGFSGYYRFGHYAFDNVADNIAMKFTVVFPFQEY